ncbi:MAG: tRNA lysidine(34) synthetase TilS, partial [Pseudothermotoga sp.]
HVEDETNLDLIYTRNYIRHKILPALKDLNNDMENTLKQVHFSAMLLKKHVSNIIEKYKDRVYTFESRIVFDSSGMDEFEIVEIIKSCLERFHVQVNYRQIEQIVWSLHKSSWTIHVAKGIMVRKGFEFISIEKVHSVVQSLEVAQEGTYSFNGWIFELARKILSNKYIFVEPHSTTIRIRRKTDRISGRKLKDIFIDCGIPQFLRDEIPIVCVQDRIVWIPDIYLNNSFKEKKNNLLVLNLLNDPYSCILKERSEGRKKV